VLEEPCAELEEGLLSPLFLDLKYMTAITIAMSISQTMYFTLSFLFVM